ncbi:hypothetical protein [Yoonia sp. R78084]|uniref:hypothetical protein n=1 Tax=Yoonia sp. R78084 TaxID=3093869 RepID=UPI0037DC342D
MRYSVLLSLLVVWPHLVAAAPLRVQTGEHADFTRVVVGLPQGTDWQIGRTPAGYAVRVSATDGFLLDEFFRLIPRDRISEVSQSPQEGELQLFVDCDCHAIASVYISNFLVIDIRDGPAPPNSPFETALVLPKTVAPNSPLPASVGVPFRPAQNRLLPLITPRFQWAEPEVPVDDDQQKQDVADISDPTVSTETADEALRRIAQALTESVGRGLSEGLLQEGLSAPSDPPRTNTTDGFMPQVAGADLPGVAARTSIDPRAIESAVPSPQTQDGQRCLPEAAFDVASWGNDSPPGQQLHVARNGLAAEDGGFAEGSLITLARLYVFLGFGREAQQALELEAVQSQDRIVLRAIAQIIDDEPVAHAVFAGQVSCPTNVALWALLAQPTAPTDAQVNRTAVVNSFRALPGYVQQAIAPRLARALLAIGAEDEALQVLAPQSTTDRRDIARALAEASLAEALGEENLAMGQIKDIARNAPRTSPEAMARFFRDGASRGIGFSDEDFLLSDALRFETADTPAASDLAEAQIVGYLSVDRFADARALQLTRRNTLSTEDFAAGEFAVYLQAAQRMPEAAFLEFVWQEDLTRLDAKTQNMVAERLVALGFPDRALAVLTSPAEEEDAAQRDVLIADILQAIAANRSTADENANVPPSDDADTFESTVTQAFNPVGQPTLRDSRSLVDTAAQARENIRALLQTVPAPTDF